MEEVHEEGCAKEFGAALVQQCDDFELRGPREGKRILVAKQAGLLEVQVDRVDRVNAVSDWSFLTLKNHKSVEAGEMVAAWRIIPLVTKQEYLDAALDCVQEKGDAAPVLQVRRYLQLKVGVIVTGSEIYERRIPEAFCPLLERKLAGFPNEWVGVRICSDSVEQILEALRLFVRKVLI